MLAAYFVNAGNLLILLYHYTTVVFKNTPQLTRIGAEAFSGCTRLNHIEIPDTVVEIADYAFYNCISLTQITLPVNIRRIGVGAFKGCISLGQNYATHDKGIAAYGSSSQ